MTLWTSQLCMIRVDTYTVSHLHDIFVVTFSSSSSLTTEKEENWRRFSLYIRSKIIHVYAYILRIVPSFDGYYLPVFIFSRENCRQIACKCQLLQNAPVMLGKKRSSLIALLFYIYYITRYCYYVKREGLYS